MNRLVIIGNGFDLAHGLPTSYKDFIDDYWKSVKNSKHDDKFISFNTAVDCDFTNVKDLRCIYQAILLLDNKVKISDAEIYIETRKDFTSGTFNRKQILVYKNDFFKSINSTSSIQNWVDIENEYYYLLKKIMKSEPSFTVENKESWQNDQRCQIKKLNYDFDEIRVLLEEYLSSKVINNYNLDIIKNKGWASFHEIFKPISVYNKAENVLEEFSSSDDVAEIRNHFAEETKGLVVNNLYFLNFNYTPISSAYSKLFDNVESVNSKVNFIHGSLGNVSDNMVNFGFGDEMDEDYKAIENLNDNEYLKNFKSFKYFQNSNYKDLLNYIDSGKYQVLIMGHSCGLSDRTLLNTVFEHNNCRSIKVFFHQVKDENDLVIKDNYTEVVQNISRHFNKKKLMREKIVNKSLCQPMPQIKLPLK